MAEISDQLLLQLNNQLHLIPEEAVLTARRRQIEVMAAGGDRRTLFEILRAEGLLDPDLEARIREHPSVTGTAPNPLARTTTVELFGPTGGPSPEGADSPPLLVVAPELGMHPTTPLITFTPPPNPAVRNPILKPSSRPRPPEVEEAEQDVSNRLGSFILVEEVGRGGTGKVYRAWDIQIGRFVALKVISSNDPDVRQRCVREAQIAGRLSHPAIATVYQAGEDQGKCYIAMQFIDGAQIGASALPLERGVALIRDAARALSYAHEQGIVHRDVKPGNLMFDKNGRIYLTDFGLAKEVMAGFGTHVSISGTVLGTPSYMSPEQAAGRVKEIDYRSDIYSLGATLYALLAGRPPFVGEGISAILMAVINRKPPPLSRFNSAVSPELEMAIARAMAKDPARRYPSMGAFADELDRLLHEKRFTGRYGWAKLLARRWVPLAAAALVAGLLGRVGLDRLSRPSASRAALVPSEERDELPGLRRDAAGALQDVELNYATLSAEKRAERIRREVLAPLDKVLKEEPGDLASQVAKARALYVDGRTEAAQAELRRLEKRTGEDYRIPLLRALLGAEAALHVPPPLPALEAPQPEWDSIPAAWPDAAGRDLQGVKAPDSAAGELREEYDRDLPVIRGLQRMAEARWAEAADAFAEARRKTTLPVIVHAWSRAAYLARRFREVRTAAAAASARERVGAGLAVALESPNPAGALVPLLKEAEGDAWASAVLCAALARSDSGTDPGLYAESALERLKAGARVAVELGAAAEASRLRWRSLSAADAEADYRKAIEALGARPVTWAGQLAAAELRLGLGARLQRSRSDGRASIEEAVRMAGELAQRSATWPAPRVLRAAARLRLDLVEEASADLDDLLRRPDCGVRAFLVAGAVRVRSAERKKRRGLSVEDDVQRARELAARALALVPDHPEGVLLNAAALMAGAEGADVAALREVAAEASTALRRAPGYGEALLLRGRALCVAGLASGAGAAARPDFQAAASDFDAVLRAEPESGPLLYMRGVVRFHLGRYDEALADWKRVLQLDPGWNAAELRSHMQQAEDRRKGR